jgi:hypothetical protein
MPLSLEICKGNHVPVTMKDCYWCTSITVSTSKSCSLSMHIHEYQHHQAMRKYMRIDDLMSNFALWNDVREAPYAGEMLIRRTITHEQQ